MRQGGGRRGCRAHLGGGDGGGLCGGGLLRGGDGGGGGCAGARVAVLVGVRALGVADGAAQRLGRHLAQRHAQALHDGVETLLGGDADGAQLVELLLGQVHAPVSVLGVRALLVGRAVHVLGALGLLKHDGARLEQAGDLGLGRRLARLGQLDQLAHLRGEREQPKPRAGLRGAVVTVALSVCCGWAGRWRHPTHAPAPPWT